jgi:tRNA 2-selenouridine synthase
MVCAIDMGERNGNPRFIRNFWEEPYSEIIDVRSEGEFAEDHVPGAVNLPVLSSAQWAEVGTIYATVSHFEARKLGAFYIAGNISVYLKKYFSGRDKLYRPLIYCWRGGLRSQSMATVLSQVGWRVTVIEGGYRTYRARVRDINDHLPGGLTLIVLSGFTGSGKTALLQRLDASGSQVLDLEEMARHRGSIMGNLWSGDPVPQPPQKIFESHLAEKLLSFHRDRPVWVESESSRIGSVHLPLMLWDRMRFAETVELRVPLEARAAFLMGEYAHFIENPGPLRENLRILVPLCGRKNVSRWLELVDSGDLITVARELLDLHYDPSYRRSMAKTFRPPGRIVDAAGLTEPDMEGLVLQMREFESGIQTGGATTEVPRGSL